MGLETRNGNGTTYLQLDYGKKSMYLYSKEEAEGYEKHTSSKGNVSYRKYINAVSGYIVNAYFRDNNFGGTDFILTFEDDGERYSVPMEIDGSVFQSVARSIENINIDNKVRLALYDSKSEKNGKSYFGVSLSYPEILDKDGKATLIEWGAELPRGKQLRNGKWDFSEANDEAYGRAEAFIETNDFETRKMEREEEEDVQEEEAPKARSKDKNSSKSKSKEVPVGGDDDDEDDKLPF